MKNNVQSELMKQVFSQPATKTKEQISEEFEHDIKEAAHWFGGWDELRKLIDQLEENDNEAAAERHFTRD